MHELKPIGKSGQKPIVYVRKIAVDDLPQDIRVQAEDAGLTQLYAIGNEEGEQLALVADRKTAFFVARQNDMSPVSVH